MRAGRPLFVALACAAATVLVSGCGGGNATRYSKPAFVACLHQNDVPTQDLSHPVTASDKAVARLLVPISPNFIAAKFPDGEYIGIAFAADAAGADRILKALKQLVNGPGATPGKLRKTGNLVMLLNPHTTAGVESTIKTCEADAVIK